jgi:hypothetical protein
LSFSGIYDRVSADSSSKLSYHLNGLTGTFPRKHENGYAFTHAGERPIRFVLAGNYQQPPAVDESATVTRTERVRRREQSDRRVGEGRSDGGPVGSEPGGS